MISGGAAATAPPRVLVVDDNDDNRYTLTLYLDLEGFTQVETANDGEAAIARLERDRFDILLLDIMMPKVDGFQVLSWIKQQPQLRDLPVIVISAMTEMESVIRCIELGAVDYLLKPFNPILLRARLGATLEKKRLHDQLNAHLARLETELAAARKLQMSMAPQAFPLPTFEFPVELAASMEPAWEVGGDLYDFFVTQDGMLWFLVGDVSGKGMPAAVYMARVKSLVRMATEFMRAGGAAVSPSDVLTRINRELCENNSGMMFVTLFFAMLAPQTGQVEFCNAGHNPPYRLHADCLQVLGGAKGLLLGVEPNAVYETGCIALAPGESIFAFTDGLIESGNAAGEVFSEARLENVLRRDGVGASARLLEAVASALRAFTGDAAPSDDVTMLAVRWGSARVD